MKHGNLTESAYLVRQVITFLEQGSYENEQLASVTALMDRICQTGNSSSYTISTNINIDQYSNETGKVNRCRAIDEALDPMFYVFRKAALNKSEPIDFSTIVFRANSSDPERKYGLIDLINTSWIKSEAPLQTICMITDGIKAYTQGPRKTPAQDRSQSVEQNYAQRLYQFLNGLLDPVIGFQRRLYLDSTNRFELFTTSLGNGYEVVRSGVAKGFSNARSRVGQVFGYNSTLVNQVNRMNNTQSVIKSNLTSSQ